MFSTHCGWLRYQPHAKFWLPRLVQVTRKVVTAMDSSPESTTAYEDDKPVTVPLCDRSGDIKWQRKLYRLEWPGELPDGHAPKEGGWDQVPAVFLERLGLCRCGKGTDTNGDGDCLACAHSGGGHGALSHSLLTAIRSGWIPPKELPLAIAYHMAVNGRIYHPLKTETPGGVSGNVHHPVAGLPAHRVLDVLDARFALDTNAVNTLKYLQWEAESWYHNPMMRGFDTMVREGLYRICWTMVQSYFWLLGDYLYDRQTFYWDKSASSHHWWQLAGCLFWAGRVGNGILSELAGVCAPQMRSIASFTQECPDVRARMLEWQGKDYNAAASHVSGSMPGIKEDNS